MFGYAVKGDTLTSYYGFNPDVTIPANVRCIGNSAVGSKNRVETVVMPPSVIEIGNHAFSFCENLYSVTFSSNLEKIGHFAFAYCTSLSEIILPAGVKTIGEAAFHDTAITTVMVPSTVTSIGRDAFTVKGCLKSVWIGKEVTKIGDNAFGRNRNTIIHTFRGSAAEQYAKAHQMKVEYLEDLLKDEKSEEPKKKTDVKKSDFKMDGTKLCNYSGCETKIHIPDGVTCIAAHAFRGRRFITDIYLPASVTSIQEHAFSSCTDLERVHFSDGLQYIGPYAFHNCHFTELHLPTSLRILEDDAFAYCDYLHTVHLPDTKIAVSPHVFSGCRHLKHLHIPAAVYVDNTESFPAALRHVTVYCAEFSTAYDMALAHNLAHVCTMPGKKESTAKYFEIHDTTLTKYVGASQLATIPDGVTAIGIMAFAENRVIREVRCPAGVTSMGTKAFFACSHLNNISLPLGVTSIAYDAFALCRELRAISLPTTLTTIGESAFSNSGLQSITIPSSVRSIGPYAFFGCTSLRVAYIPASVTAIGIDAFRLCEKLTICAPEDSYAYRYAVENDIPVTSRYDDTDVTVTSEAPPASIDLPGHLSRTCYDRLTDDQKRAYVAMLKAVYRMDDSCDATINYGDFVRIAEAIECDYPDIFWVDWRHCSPSRWSYWITREEKERRAQAVEAVVASFLRSVPPHLSDYDKAKYATDWLMRHVEYDHVGLEEEKRNGVRRPDDLRTVYGAFCHRAVVCAGYAVALQYLFQRLGLESVQYRGFPLKKLDEDHAGHAWAMVKLDGEYYHVDATWNDDAECVGSYPFFCVTDEDMLTIWPILENFEQRPVARSTIHNYYHKNGLFFEDFDPQKVLGVFRRELEKGERKMLQFRSNAANYNYVYDFCYGEELKKLLSEFGITSAPHLDHIRLGVFKIELN